MISGVFIEATQNRGIFRRKMGGREKGQTQQLERVSLITIGREV
jgi:hypothetical protein